MYLEEEKKNRPAEKACGFWLKEFSCCGGGWSGRNFDPGPATGSIKPDLCAPAVLAGVSRTTWKVQGSVHVELTGDLGPSSFLLWREDEFTSMSILEEE